LINIRLAEAAQAKRIAMGLGSQRAALVDPSIANSFNLRKLAPDIPIFANIGAVQLNYSVSSDDCKKLVASAEANGLILHLNPLQEAIQPEGNTNFSGLLKKIEKLCSSIGIPVIVKEVGWGISSIVARKLIDAGVSAIDIAGAAYSGLN
jgi:isopentenyl-diphosphate delta-isomerase